jgi:FkbM family methyltransferase
MADLILQFKNGWAVMPASLKSPAGVSRFNLEFPVYLHEDLGAQNLVLMDDKGGYELPSRNLLERALRRGDLFIDVGAHWGYFTLQAATHPAGDVQVLAFEPEPTNAGILFRTIVGNGLTGSAELVFAACGDRFDLAPLVSNSSMAHSIRGVGIGAFFQGPSKRVPVIPLDTALAYFPQAADRRVILKVDAEGFEPQVIAGARDLLRSGRVALVIWECGHGSAEGAERGAMVAMVEFLSQRGFRHFRAPGHDLDGPYVPFTVDEPLLCNVFSFGPDLEV